MDSGGIPPFDDPFDVQWFVKAANARCDEIARDLLRGKLQPIIDIDERNGEALWEYWIDGFAEATALRPDGWALLADAPGRVEPWSRMMALIAIARDEIDLDSIEVNTFQSRAVVELTDTVQHLYAAGARGGEMETLGGPAKRRPGICGSYHLVSSVRMVCHVSLTSPWKGMPTQA